LKPLLRQLAAVALAAAVTATALAVSPATAAGPTGQVTPAGRDAIAGQYVVVLNDSVEDVSGTVRRLAGPGKVLHTYRHALKGAALKVTAAQARKIAADPGVSSVQQDAVVRASGDVDAQVAQAVPAPPSTWWGLNRLDQRPVPPNAAGVYNFLPTAPAVTAYVVDTGILYSHAQFGGRATFGVDTVGGVAPPGTDCHGHGTHVSGTIGGSTYGVAKAVKLKAVRVLDCGGSGTLGGVIAGLDWVKANAVKPAVVNMSLGGGASIALNIATNDLVESGVTVVVAAGNSDLDACDFSPASTLSAITVGATGDRFQPNAPITDARSDYSNFGPCLDIFAPGSLIRSSWIGSNTAFNTISGTSMASPHVAGVAALYLAAAPTALPATVRNGIVELSTPGVVVNPGVGSPNRMVFSGTTASLTINANPEPVTKGGNVTSVGTLSVAGKTLAGRTVQVWFDPVGSAPAVYRGSAVTNGSGAYTKTATQSADGYWFAKFLGGPLVWPVQSGTDFVDCSNC
jgi:subtilisin family serine protease